MTTISTTADSGAGDGVAHSSPASGPREHVPARHVVVVGGGISGLAAALRLLELDEGLRVTLLEAEGRLGGKILTTRDDGFLVEGGPDLFLGAKPGAFELCARLGIAHRLHGTAPGVRGSYVLSRGRLLRLPEGLTGLIPSRLAPFVRTPLVSIAGKLRVALDLVIPRRKSAGDDDESVEQFVVRRLGREMYERLVEPLLSGIYAGDGARLSLLATFPHLRQSEREHGGLLRATFAARRRPSAPLAGGRTAAHLGFLTLPGGLGELVDAAAARLAASGRAVVRLRTPAQGVAAEGHGWRVELPAGEQLAADAVVIATPAHAAAALLAPLDRDAATALGEIEHVSTIVVSLGFRGADVPRALDASGYTVPRAEGRAVLACTWSSSKFPGRAAEGHALLRLYLGGATRPDVSGMTDAEVLALARAEVREVLGIAAEPVLVRVQRWERALPQPNLGHPARVARIAARMAQLPGLALAGNAYHGVGIPDCVRSGERAAEAVHARLAHLTHSRSS